VKDLALGRTPLLYPITDRRKLAQRPAYSGHHPSAYWGPDPSRTLLSFIERALSAGVEMIQIREPGFSAREQYVLTRQAVDIASGFGGVVLINDRADIAAACPGAGVHLTTRSMSVTTVRHSFGTRMLIGASTHSLAEAEAAEKQGADFIVFGPVYETESKREYGPPLGLDALAKVAKAVGIPVLALGGINRSNFREALDQGASGIAGISLFAEAPDLGTQCALLKA
jgi:thiamine-phosphate pyrophosphorylase